MHGVDIGESLPRRVRVRRAAAVVLALLGTVMLNTTTALGSTQSKECPIKTNTSAGGATLKKPIELTPTQQSAQKLVNFDTSREFKVIRHLTVTASKPLPATLQPSQIDYDAVLSRTGNTLETAEFPDPTFSPAYISEDRRSISFAVCLNPKGISAGKYVGFITVSGPEGLGSASIGLTANAKDGLLFYISGGLALLAALALLLLKHAADAASPIKWEKSTFGAPFGEPLWCAATVITLFSTFGAVYTIYANDPAWGASGFASLVALVGAATAAVGGHTILTTLGSRVVSPKSQSKVSQKKNGK